MNRDLKIKRDAGEPRFCPVCGAILEGNDIFCSRCGYRLMGEVEEPIPAKLTWEKSINLFTDKHVFKGLALAFGVAMGFLFLFLLIANLAEGTFNWASIRSFLLIVLAVAGILVVSTIIAMLILGGWRYPYKFTVDRDGILIETADRQRRKNTFLNSLGFFLGLLKGKPGVMGSAILAQSRQSEFLRWEDIRLIKPDQRSRSIVLKLSRGRTSVLWCPPEKYEEILSSVLNWHRRAESGQGKKSREKKRGKG